MTDLRKAVEDAIDALQTAVKFANHVGYGGWKDTAVQCHEATASLRTALEAALKPGEPDTWPRTPSEVSALFDGKQGHALRASVAAALRYVEGPSRVTRCAAGILEDALKTGEPVAKYIGECPMGSLVQLYDDLKNGTYLYGAAPPPPAQTPPPLLTEPQIQWCWNTACHSASKFDQQTAFARTIESAVRHQFTNT